MLWGLLIGAAMAGPTDGVTLGLGYRSSAGPMDKVQIVRAVGRKATQGTLTYEVAVGARANGEEVTDLVHTLVSIAEQGSGNVEFQQPITQEKWSVDLLVDWSIVPRESSPDKWTGGPRLVGGLVFLGSQSGYATYNSGGGSSRTALSIEDSIFEYGAAAGVSFDLMKGRYGARLGFLDRIIYRDKPQYDSSTAVRGKELVHHSISSIDLLIRL
jgi:hypothetical protein